LIAPSLVIYFISSFEGVPKTAMILYIYSK